MSAEDLENYETEMELSLYREYRDIVGQFSPDLWEGTDWIINSLGFPSASPQGEMSAGSKVRHIVFGEGEIIQMEQDTGTVMVQFKDFGKRRLRPENLIFAE